MPLPPRVPVDKVMAESRAASFTKRSIKASAKRRALDLAMSMVDLTTLEGKDTPEKVRSLCRKAVDPSDGLVEGCPRVAAICVYPQLVAAARKQLDALGNLANTPEAVKIASVATGFPSGQYPLKVRLDDTKRAIDAGADEIDMVISRGDALAGRWSKVYDEISATCEACGWSGGLAKSGGLTKAGGSARAGGAGLRPTRNAPVSTPHRVHLKVILETGELETLDTVRYASDVAIAAMHASGMTSEPGAGFIKTSTGKVEPAATMPVTLVMLQAIADHYDATGTLVGMKPAGGIRTSKTAIHYLVMVKETLGHIESGAYLSPHLFRFGASALVNDLARQMLWLAKGRYAARYDFAEA